MILEKLSSSATRLGMTSHRMQDIWENSKSQEKFDWEVWMEYRLMYRVELEDDFLEDLEVEEGI